MNKKNNRITVKDVARKAGVSTAAAGRALGGYGYVSEELREKIIRAAEELGYVANQVARAMITGKSQTIGVVGAGVIMVVHDPALAYRFCDRALLLHGDGRAETGPVDALLTAERLSALYGHTLRQIDDGGHRHFVPE